MRNMEYKPDYLTARNLLLELAVPAGTERVPLSQCGGRVLARDLTAGEAVPPFDRSAYDGYALRAADTAQAGGERPVTLRILEEVPAGACPSAAVEAGTAVKILTGAPIPPGADTVVPFERTRFDENSVTVSAPLKAGGNIVRRGEDAAQGALLVRAGDVLDPAAAGTLAAQGVWEPLVYRLPEVGIVSTGNEVVEADGDRTEGKIRNSNRSSLEAVLRKNGCLPRYLGLAGDSLEAIRARIEEGLERCDAVILTGGVSVGDYDLTPAAMERSGVELAVRGVAMKPGMACAYGVRDGKLVIGLSGNPASSLMNFYAAVLPALKKLAGRREVLPREITAAVAGGFPKSSPMTRFLLGTLDLSDGTVRVRLPGRQGNAVLTGGIGCDAAVIVPAGSGPVEEQTRLRGFLL